MKDMNSVSFRLAFVKWLSEAELKKRERERGYKTAYVERLLAKNPNANKERAARYYAANREICLVRTVAWQNKNKERVRAVERARVKAKPELAYQKGLRRRKAHPEKIRALHRDWCRRNPDKKRAKDHRYRARQYNAIGAEYTTAEHITGRWLMWNNCCWLCKKPATHTDHVKPLDKGGHHYPANLRPICLSCNSRKKNRWPFPLYVFNAVGAPLLPRKYLRVL